MESSADLRPIFDGISADQQRMIPVRDQLAMWQEAYGTRNVEISEDANPDIDSQFQGTTTMSVRSQDDFRNPMDEDQLSGFITERDDFGDIEEDLAEKVYVKEGDLVEVYNRINNSTILAICSREIGRQLQLYTSTGKWIHRRLISPQFKLSGFASSEEIKPILPYLPTEEVSEEEIDRAKLLGWDVPRSVSGPLVTKMNDFWNETKMIYRQHATRLDGAHRILAHRTKLRFATLERIAKTLLFKDSDSKIQLTGPQLFAVHHALRSLNFEFATDARSHRMTNMFQIRPLEEVELVREVQTWIREFQDWIAQESLSPAEIAERATSGASKGTQTVHNFIKKAYILVKESRQTRTPGETGCVGPSKIKRNISDSQDAIKMWTSLKFTEDETKIIKFLENTCINKKFKENPELSGLAASLVRLINTNVAKDILGNAQIHCFLQEIGVLLPWENRVPYEENLLLPVAEHSKPLLDLSIAANDLNNANFEDRMKDLRKDWGNMAVFCIDSVGAKEIDDGISIERIDGKDEYWIHIHIANPTAFLSPKHPMSKMAAHMTESFYFPEKDWPMLPPTVTQQFFSLENHRPVLTFSVRLNSQGEILDKRVQNGTIRNVITVNWDQINNALGYLDTRADVVLTVGEVPEMARPKAKELTLTAQEIDDLRTLECLARQRFEHRQKTGGQHFHQERNDIAVYTRASGPGIPLALPSRRVARYFAGDPVIQLRGKESDKSFSSTDTSMIVTEMMLMCCEVAAAWARERSLPIPYRGTIDNPNLGDRETFLKENIQPLLDQNLPIPLLMARKLVRLGGQTAITSEPLRHKYIGVEQYTKATSPLRRYGDMVTHWQIEAALREEARTGKSLASPNAKPIVNDTRPWLEFSRAYIDVISDRLLPREKAISTAKSQAHEHWTTQLFYRAFYFGEAKLKEELTIVLEGGVAMHPWIGGKILEYGCQAHMYEPKEYGFGWDGQLGSGDSPQGTQTKVSASVHEEGGFGWRVGDVWAATIDNVNPFLRTIYLRPLRLISREIPIV